ncbi:helix-turn-helix transcriptional regulator [Stenotrophomonas sp. SMYL36]|uniref:helix-turn-helix transcriptional regulator n=1 Tax=Stenotrophomonas sp. SMYL36 TaxID=3076045 RepID=UPI002E76471B|nr:helix-turn-helix transcriptional regulator [Stenotrophomonas sp. SMYL36]
MDIAELLDLAQARTHAEYDSALARKLGVSRQTISNWRVGRTFPDAKACGRISEATGMPLNEIMGLVGEERATDQEEKAVWRRLAGRAAAILVAVSAGTFAQPNQAQATAFKGFSGSDQPHSVYYVQFTIARSMLRLPWPRSDLDAKSDCVERCEFGAACAATCSN